MCVRVVSSTVTRSIIYAFRSSPLAWSRSTWRVSLEPIQCRSAYPQTIGSMRGQRPAQPPAASRRAPREMVLLAVDQELGERAALGIAPELSDPVGSLEVRQHEDVERLGPGSRPERVRALTKPALELVGPHGLGDYAGVSPTVSCRSLRDIYEHAPP